MSRSSRLPTRCSAAWQAMPRQGRASSSGCDVGDGEAAALALWREAGVKVLPGGYLGRAAADGVNPGDEYIRVALVAGPAEVARGLTAIRAVLGQMRFRRTGKGRKMASTQQGQASGGPGGERHRGRLAPPGYRAAGADPAGLGRARLRHGLELFAGRSEPVQRHRCGAAQRAGAGRGLAGRSAAPGAGLGGLRDRGGARGLGAAAGVSRRREPGGAAGRSWRRWRCWPPRPSPRRMCRWRLGA